MFEKTFKLSWRKDLGNEWMNIDNLKQLLFSKEHSKKELITVKEIK